MTDLRDARFQRALDEAPDAGLRPDRGVRESILEAARAALAQDKPASHWKKWWNVTGSSSPVWNAAFASVAIATLVTLLWRDREIPDAGLTSPSADKQAPAPMVVPPAVVAQQAPAATSRAPVTVEAAPKRKPKEEVQAKAEVEQPAKAQAVAPAPAAPPATFAPPAPAPTIASDIRESAVAPSAAGALARSASRSETRAFRAAPAPVDDHWTNALIQSGGRSVRIEHAQAERLPQLLASVARSSVAARAAESSQAVALRIELTAGTATDIIEVIEGQVRWTRLREGQPRQVTSSTPDAALLQALQSEAERLLAR